MYAVYSVSMPRQSPATWLELVFGLEIDDRAAPCRTRNAVAGQVLKVRYTVRHGQCAVLSPGCGTKLRTLVLSFSIMSFFVIRFSRVYTSACVHEYSRGSTVGMGVH